VLPQYPNAADVQNEHRRRIGECLLSGGRADEGRGAGIHRDGAAVAFSVFAPVELRIVETSGSPKQAHKVIASGVDCRGWDKYKHKWQVVG